MSVRVSSSVWQASKSRLGDRLVLLAIADFADDEGRAYPAVKKLSEKTALDERSVQRSVQSLISLGELAVDRNTGPHGVNVYRVTLPPAECHPRQNVAPANTAPPPANTTEGVTNPTKAPGKLPPKPSGTVKDPSVDPSVPAPGTAAAPRGRAIRGKPMEIPHESEILLFASEIGLPELEAKKFFLHYSATGWRAGGSKLHDWQSKMRGWKITAAERKSNGPGRHPAPQKPHVPNYETPTDKKIREMQERGEL